MAPEPTPPPGRIRFGDFEVDRASHELWRFGRRVRLQEKSFLVLDELLRNPGQMVTRERLFAVLWPKDYFVDSEHGLNAAVRRLREALGDSAEAPRYVETLPKLGYRFIAPVTEGRPAHDDSGPHAEPTAVAVSAAPPTPSLVAVAAPAAPARGGWNPVLASGTLGRHALFAAAAVLGVVAVALVTVGDGETSTGAVSAGAPAAAAPGAAGELLARARYLRNHKRLLEAHRFVEEALRLDPENPEALAGLALGQLGQGREDEAGETARRALELDPETWEAHRVLGHLARRQGDFAGAERHYRRAVDANPSDYKTRNRLARHLLECGRLEEARDHIVETRRLAPDDPDVQNIWIQYALLNGEYESAIRQGQIWLAVWEGQIGKRSLEIVREMLGLAYVGARRRDAALAQFQAIDPDDDLLAALALGHAGRTDEALAILRAHEAAAAASAEEPDPDRIEAMAKASILIGDLDRAFAHLDRLVDARRYPGWLHIALFHSIRRDSRWAAFAERLEKEFFRGKQAPVRPARREPSVESPEKPHEPAAGS